MVKLSGITLDLQHVFCAVNDSGVQGKSTLIHKLYGQSVKDSSKKVEDTLFHHCTSLASLLFRLQLILIEKNETSVVFTVDENCVIGDDVQFLVDVLNKDGVWDYLLQYVRFLIVGRNNLVYRLPLADFNNYVFTKNEVRPIELEVPILHNLDAYDIIVIEDESSGYSYFKSLLHGKTVLTCKGKDNIARYLKYHIPNKGKVLCIYDSLGIGIQHINLLGEFGQSGNVTLAPIKSFEYMLLSSGYFPEANLKPTGYNLEECYESELNKQTQKHKMFPYSKSTDCGTCYVLPCDKKCQYSKVCINKTHSKRYYEGTFSFKDTKQLDIF